MSDYYSESRSNTDWPGRWKKKESELNRVDWPNFRRDAGLMNAIQTKPRLIDQLLQRCTFFAPVLARADAQRVGDLLWAEVLHVAIETRLVKAPGR